VRWPNGRQPDRHAKELHKYFDVKEAKAVIMLLDDYSADYRRCERDVIAQLEALVKAGARPETFLLAFQCGDHRGKAGGKRWAAEVEDWLTAKRKVAASKQDLQAGPGGSKSAVDAIDAMAERMSKALDRLAAAVEGSMVLGSRAGHASPLPGESTLLISGGRIRQIPKEGEPIKVNCDDGWHEAVIDSSDGEGFDWSFRQLDGTYRNGRFLWEATGSYSLV
jgi:hypothetical protein